MTSQPDEHGLHNPPTVGIGGVVLRAVVTERTLRCYEEPGVRAPARDAGGRRRYDGGTLYRVRLLGELGTPAPDVNPETDDLGELTCPHLADLDTRLADFDRGRETVRAAEDRLLNGDRPGDEALLDLLSVLPTDKPALTRRITPLVYRGIAAHQAIVVDALGTALGPIAYPSGRVAHGEVRAGDGVVSLHRRGPEHQMVSPLTAGTTSR